MSIVNILVQSNSFVFLRVFKVSFVNTIIRIVSFVFTYSVQRVDCKLFVQKEFVCFYLKGLKCR